MASLLLHERRAHGAARGLHHDRARELAPAAALDAALPLLPLRHLAVLDEGVLPVHLVELLADGLDPAERLRTLLDLVRALLPVVRELLDERVRLLDLEADGLLGGVQR